MDIYNPLEPLYKVMRIQFIIGSVETTQPSENVVHTLLNTKNYRDKMNYLEGETDIKSLTQFSQIFFRLFSKCKRSAKLRC